MNSAGAHVLIVGGGVVGTACAHYLNESGFRVTVIDKGRIGGECSYGNCGLVCPSHVLPLAEPGAIGAALKALVKPRSPFRVRPRFSPALWRWMWRFARRCNHDDMLESGRAIHPLLASSLELYRELLGDGKLDCEWQTHGLLFAYRTERALDAYEPTNKLLTEQFNEPARRMSGNELREFEPALRAGLAGAWYFEHDAHLRPDRLMSSWREWLQDQGVTFYEQMPMERLERSDNRVIAVTAGGQSIEADQFVMATGAWTPQLASLLNYRVPIEPGKGYSLVVPRNEATPHLPIIFPEHRVVVTPLQKGMRIGSIMEFAGYDSAIKPSRLRMLTDSAALYLDGAIPDQISDKWYGWRPMTYDSTPVIGTCPGFSNVYLATGHNMLGLSMAPATGRLITELIQGGDTHLDARPYRAERFG